MEFFAGVFAALVIAAVFTLVYSLVARPRLVGPQAARDSDIETGIGLVWLFLLIFLFSWSGALWIMPVGPMYWGVPWVPLLYIGLISILLFSGLRLRSERDVNISSGVDIFLWLVVGLLVIAILVRILSTLPWTVAPVQ